MERIKILVKEFEVIKSKGWIKAINNHSSSIGSTFERELSIKENRIPYADYYGIEIKCTTKKDDFYISLFSAEPNSKIPNLIEDIAKKYGYPHKIEKKINVLNSRINYTSINNISFKYRANIYMDYKYNIIKILIENKFGQIVDERITWDINYIKEKVIDKCLYLAIIKSETKLFSGVQYVKYNEIKVYKLKSEIDFIKSIESGAISICFKVSGRKNKMNEYEPHNHGTSFQIRLKDLELIYTKVH